MILLFVTIGSITYWFKNTSTGNIHLSSNEQDGGKREYLQQSIRQIHCTNPASKQPLTTLSVYYCTFSTNNIKHCISYLLNLNINGTSLQFQQGKKKAKKWQEQNRCCVVTSLFLNLKVTSYIEFVHSDFFSTAIKYTFAGESLGKSSHTAKGPCSQSFFK